MVKIKPDYVEDDRLTCRYNSIVLRFDGCLYPACEPPMLSGLTPILSKAKEAKKSQALAQPTNNLARHNGHLHVEPKRDAKV